MKWTQSYTGTSWGVVIRSQVSVRSVIFGLIVNKEPISYKCLDKYFLGYTHSLRASLDFERVQPTDVLPFADTV